ncbi:MAG: P-loop NTPase [Christensenellaceae bacterium]|jgi:septum site-determining protein MinD|nr:P-loop NTPase [Christensenellaceae bacterium]
MCKKVLICSGKGGVGKTTVAANLSLALCAAGYKVIAADCDYTLNNLEIAFNLENTVKYGIADCLSGRVFLGGALYPVAKHLRNNPNGGSLFLLSSHGCPFEKSELSETLSLCSKLADYIIIDSRAGQTEELDTVASIATDAIIVTTPHIAAIRDADKVAATLDRYELDSVSLAVNRVRADHIENSKAPAPSEISSLIRVPLSATLPEDDEINLSATVSPFVKSRSQEAYKMFALLTANGSGEVYQCETARKSGIMSRFKELFN